MSDVIDRLMLDRRRPRGALRIIDNIHPSIHSLRPTNSCRSAGSSISRNTAAICARPIGTTGIRAPPALSRGAWSPTGGVPLRSRLHAQAAPRSVRCRVRHLAGARPLIFSQQNLEFGAAIQRAINDWQLVFCRIAIQAEGLDPSRAGRPIWRSPRSSAVKTGEYIQSTCRRAPTSRSAAAVTGRSTSAQALDLPLGIHVGGYGGHAPTGGGWPSYYCEEHQSNAHTVASNLTSLVLEGVPERFPKLKIVFIEGGFGWIPATMWRMDQHFERFRSEVPHLKRRPSEYVKRASGHHPADRRTR